MSSTTSHFLHPHPVGRGVPPRRGAMGTSRPTVIHDLSSEGANDRRGAVTVHPMYPHPVGRSPRDRRGATGTSRPTMINDSSSEGENERRGAVTGHSMCPHLVGRSPRDRCGATGTSRPTMVRDSFCEDENGRRRGSLLMEFVIVLPIYMALFVFAFTMTDVGLAVLDAVVGDRNVQHENTKGQSWNMFNDYQVQPGKENEGRMATEAKTLRADEDFKGAWTLFTAGKATFNYVPHSYLAGWISGVLFRYDDSFGGILRTLANQQVVHLTSRDKDDERHYGYYALKRSTLVREPNAYRQWAPAKLRYKNCWTCNVRDEQFVSTDSAAFDDAQSPLGAGEPSEQGTSANDYSRKTQLMLWSQ